MTSRMITEEKMIVIFVVSTGWTVLTMVRIATMNDMTDGEKSMRPFDRVTGENVDKATKIGRHSIWSDRSLDLDQGQFPSK